MIPLLGRDEDCVRADPVLVDQSAALYVVKVDIAVLGDQIDDAVPPRNLDGYGKVVLRLISSTTFSVLRLAHHLVEPSPKFEIVFIEIVKLHLKSFCFPVVVNIWRYFAQNKNRYLRIIFIFQDLPLTPRIYS